MDQNKTTHTWKKKTNQRLLSDEDQILLKRRSLDVEPVLGHIKQNRGFRRFMLKGLDKVNIEWDLLAFAHNLLKIHSIRLKIE